ncbi:MAG: hypothetical protein E7L00_05955 [Propionibacteriaceae bacterium]|nr:hypothetical protein [Propionibacteriaceae bacterium]
MLLVRPSQRLGDPSTKPARTAFVMIGGAFWTMGNLGVWLLWRCHPRVVYVACPECQSIARFYFRL